MKTPAPHLARRELGAALWAGQDAFFALACHPWAPRAVAKNVLVLPGLKTGDRAMSTMHELLRRDGYVTMGWGHGHVDAFTLEHEERLVHLVERSHAMTGKKTAIVGWSMGGIYSRAIAQASPDSVSQVITLGTPHRGLQYTTPAAAYERRTGKRLIDGFTSAMTDKLGRIAGPVPVPCASIYSRDDGIVDWEACHMPLDCFAKSQSIEVSGQHMSLPFRLKVFNLVGDILAQDADGWRPHPKAFGLRQSPTWL
jgi:pimeloyl-ACP methyl ester carboxylesterase